MRVNRIGRVINNISSNEYTINFYGVYQRSYINDVIVYGEDNIYNGIWYDTRKAQFTEYNGEQVVQFNSQINENYVLVSGDFYGSYYSYRSRRMEYDNYGNVVNTIYGNYNYIVCDVLTNLYFIDLNKQLNYNLVIDRLFLEYQYATRQPYYVDIKYYDNGQWQIKKKVLLYSLEQVKFNLQLTYNHKIKTASYRFYRIYPENINVCSSSVELDDIYNSHNDYIQVQKYIKDANDYKQQIYDFVLEELGIPNLNDEGYFYINNDIFFYDDWFLSHKRRYKNVNKIADLSKVLATNIIQDDIYLDLHDNIISSLNASGYNTLDNNYVYWMGLDKNLFDGTDTTIQYQGLVFTENSNQTDLTNYIFSFKLDTTGNVILDNVYQIPLAINNVKHEQYIIRKNQLVLLCDSRLFNSKSVIIILKLSENKDEIEKVYWNTTQLNILNVNIRDVNDNIIQYILTDNNAQKRTYFQYDENFGFINNNHRSYQLLDIYYGMLDSNEKLVEIHNYYKDGYIYEYTNNLTTKEIEDYMMLDYGKFYFNKLYLRDDSTIYELLKELYYDVDDCMSDLNIKIIDGTANVIYHSYCDIDAEISGLSTTQDYISKFYDDNTFIFLKKKDNIDDMQLPQHLVIYNNSMHNTTAGFKIVDNYEIYRILRPTKDNLFVFLR